MNHQIVPIPSTESRACPAAQAAVSTWTRCGERHVPRRANEGYTAELPTHAHLVSKPTTGKKARTGARAPVPRLTHSACPQSRSTSPPLAPTAHSGSIARQTGTTHCARVSNRRSADALSGRCHSGRAQELCPPTLAHSWHLRRLRRWKGLHKQQR